MALLCNKKTCVLDGVKVNIKYYTLSKSWVKWSLQDHNTKSFIARNIILHWRLFPGHSFHKIVRFYIVVLEEGCSKTDMEMIGISLRVLFWLVLIGSGNAFTYLYETLFAWEQVATALLKVIRKDTKQLHTSLLWFLFCWYWRS